MTSLYITYMTETSRASQIKSAAESGALSSLRADVVCMANFCRGMFKDIQFRGKTYSPTHITIYASKRADVEAFFAEEAANVSIIGVWNKDGSPLGQYFDENGVLQGTPEYPMDETTILSITKSTVDGFIPTTATEALATWPVWAGQMTRRI